LLAMATFSVVIVTASIPHLSFASILGFQTMPPHFYPIIALIILAYVFSAELVKHAFYRSVR
jgi:P-type Mg2+ transporter